MLIHIRSKNTHVLLFQISVARRATLRDLKHAIWKRDSTLQPERQRLYWQDEALVDCKTMPLAWLGIRHKAMLDFHFWQAGASLGHYWNGKHLVLPSEHDWFVDICLFAAMATCRNVATKIQLLQWKHRQQSTKISTDHPYVGLHILCFQRPRGIYSATQVRRIATSLQAIKQTLFSRFIPMPQDNKARGYKAKLARTLYTIISAASAKTKALSQCAHGYDSCLQVAVTH